MLRHGVVTEREPDTRRTNSRESTQFSLSRAVRLRSHVALVAILFAVALLIRLDGISKPSIQTRELRNALLAREYYLSSDEGLPAWKRRVLDELHDLFRPIEPPILDVLAGSTFRLTGGERLWIPRLWSTLFWLLGGVFLYRIATRVTRREGAIFALALYLFWPYPAFISRLYQPDALMISLLLGGALTIIRYWEQPSRSRLAAAASTSAAAVLVKPGIAFVFLVGLFVALAASRRALLESVARGRLPLFVALSLVPTGAYYLYSVHADYFLAGQSDGWIDPTKWWTAWFWNGWWEMLSIMLAFPQHQTYLAVVPLALGLAGALVTRGTGLAILLGLFGAYVLFALALTGPIATHPYYSLPFVPTISLAIGAFVGFAAEWLERRAPAARARVLAVGGVAIFVAVTSIFVAVYKAHSILAAKPPLQQIADYQRIGEVTGHTTRAIYVDLRLGSPITYWGWIDGYYWYSPTPVQDLPASGNPFPTWIDAARAEKAEYLIVVETSELATEKRLSAFTRGLPVVERTPRYAVFDLRGGRAVAAARDSSLAKAP
jgi:4-amino-4-deoxy-L-arabinose transferase-like glycosyltransferase